MIPQSFIQDLLNRLDIVDVVEVPSAAQAGGHESRGLLPVPQRKDPVVHR